MTLPEGSLIHLVGDVIALIEEFGEEQAVVVVGQQVSKNNTTGRQHDQHPSSPPHPPATVVSFLTKLTLARLVLSRNPLWYPGGG